ncbi:MAG TPA: class I SAM-dependent methyltransferase [Thermoanaerobaculia bacterium]|nr:class I SAM-dependent methyltransferase [Thermoanaerobaculia bacterium]
MLSRQAARWGNAWRRLRRGLPARGSRVSPEAANDLFLAHLAVYDFAAKLVAGGRVLDLGCGTGYGSSHLLAAGAAAVVGLDPDAAGIAYATRRFGGPRLRFVRGRAEDLPAALPAAAERFELIVAANLLAHLPAPGEALAAAARVLAPNGSLVASVPPIVDDLTMDQHRAGGLHRSNRYLWGWESLLREHFAEPRLFRLLPPAGVRLDLGDPRRSRLALAGFRCEELPLSRLEEAGSLTAIFVCGSPRGASTGPAAGSP